MCDMGEVWILSCLSFGLDRTIVYSINNDLNLFRDFYKFEQLITAINDVFGLYVQSN